MASIQLQRLTRRFPGGALALRELDLEIEDGELMVLVGPSGSGKSTALRLIAGLEMPTSGTVRIGEQEVTDLPPQERNVAMVFQSYALYPHMTVRENLGFGLRMRRAPKAEVERRIAEVAESLDIGELLDRKPGQLSGGQRQRVALGRAIAREPAVFLLDEPLSNLDARLRTRTRAELARLHRRLGTTMVYVTHDQTEAMTLGTRVAVLDKGTLQQVGTPMELYERPANRFVAEFIGSPSMNLVEGRIDPGVGGEMVFAGGGIRLPLSAGPAAGPAVLGVRPHHVALGDSSEGAAVRAEAEIVEALGSEQVVHLRTADGQELVALAPAAARIREGDVLTARISPDGVHLFDAGSGARIPLAPGA